MTDDIVQARAETPGRVLILSHPTQGTLWLQAQLRHISDGLVAHETLKNRRLVDYDTVISYRFWSRDVFARFDHVWALTRDPLRTVASSESLYRNGPAFKAATGAYFFGDGIPGGPAWELFMRRPPLEAAMATLEAFYRAAEKAAPERWFRIEDAAQVRPASSNTKKPRPLTWDDLYRADPVSAAELAMRAEERGYNIK